MTQRYEVGDLWVIVDKALKEDFITLEDKRVLGLLSKECLEHGNIPKIKVKHDMVVVGYDAGFFIRHCRCGETEWPCPRMKASKKRTRK